MANIQENTFALHFTTTYLPRNDGSQQPVIVTVNISTQHKALLGEAHDKYAEVRNTKNAEYLLHNVQEHSQLPLSLDNTVAEAGFSITNPWVKIRPIIFVNDGPIFLPEDNEEDPNSADQGYPITLNLFTTTYNVGQTPITIIVKIPTYSKERLREVNTKYVSYMNHRKECCLFYNPRHPIPRHFLDMNNNTVEEADLDNTILGSKHPGPLTDSMQTTFPSSVKMTQKIAPMDELA
jgi:hypothetical protein